MSFFSGTTYRIAKYAVSLAWLLCLGLGSVSAIPVDSLRSGDLVFCPLQQKWVNKAGPREPRLIAPLSRVCARDQDKAIFLKALAARANVVPPKSRIAIDDLFFKFRSKGDLAFAEMPASPGSPDIPLAVIENLQGRACIGRSGFAAVVAQMLSFEELCRPPTQHSVSNFPTSLSPDLRSAANAISPRGPPVVS